MKKVKGLESIQLAVFLLLFALILTVIVKFVSAVPVGPTASSSGSSTRDNLGNASVNDSTGGGYIYTYTFSVTEQNARWKAYVGNVTGTLVLDDADSYTIYEWDLGSSASGEVYATRNFTAIDWTNINCSWAPDGTKSVRTVENRENVNLEHTRMDNITATFASSSHPTFDIGQKNFPSDHCWAAYPFVNDTSQSTLGTEYFAEIIMYDATYGSIVYVSLISDDTFGYHTNYTYDFQMILPEVGADTWESSTAYYFYVELV